MGFRPPTGDIAFAIRTIAGADAGSGGELAADTLAAILDAAARFAGDTLAPLNRVGDREGVTFDDGAVATAPGWRKAYAAFAEAGWSGLGAPPEAGGQGLPVIVQMAVEEMWNGANAAFAVNPMLTGGAIRLIAAHAAAGMRAELLPHLVSGRWTGTMNLTEPQAGSDLGALAARAEPGEDGAWRLFGQKIFITYGDHDLADNIVHLVLARLPGAPVGSAGISLFAVPKVLADGTRNRVACAGIEEKLGLHGAPTCTMAYDGAAARLIGPPHGGLACMFTMMNHARLAVGIQAVGVADRAFADALAYARGRRQGRSPGWSGAGMSPIVMHPDVQAMLLRMKALTAAARMICYACAHAIDMSERGPADLRPAWSERAAVLTPVAKAFAADAGIEVASLGIQVHGGAGYIEETGAAQHLRDVRVFAIYEGTNGIQAIDLATRKLRRDGGRAIRRLAEEIAATGRDAAASGRAGLGRSGQRILAAAADLERATAFLLAATAAGTLGEVLAGATPYLRLLGLATGGALLARAALLAGEAEAACLARYFAETVLGETSALALTVTEGSEALRQGAALLVEPAALE